jgi:hypothetical protein
MRTPFAICASLLAILMVAGVAAAQREVTRAQTIYAAFSLISKGKPVTRKCGRYTLTTAAFTGTSTSPDPRLAGSAALTARFVVNPDTSYGYASGSLTVRSRGALRAKATLSGVISPVNVVNGIFSGSLYGPNALLLANASIIFNENFTFAAVRLGIESGANTAIAYSGVPRC